MAATASAEAGFVAYSQVIAGRAGGSVLALDATGYPPIRQDAVLLAHGAKNEAAIAFADFLRSADALPILERFGYSPP